MKLAVFDAHTYDRDALAAANGRYAHDLTFFEPRLTRQTAAMATGFPAVCSFVNDRVDAETLASLQAGGTRLIALRSAGYNHVDLDEAGRCAIVVVGVPEYSPHAVAEHTVALLTRMCAPDPTRDDSLTRLAMESRVEVPLAYEEVVERTTQALKSEGFGVLTTIDVKQTLDRDFRKYVILGACNPPLADRALHAEIEVGLLLPCSVIVYETEPGRTVVAAMAPIAALGIVGDNPQLPGVAQEADQRLRRALTSLETR